MKSVKFNDSISIVIPLHNKEHDIERTLKNITKYIKSSNLEILVIENESTDLSLKIAKEAITDLEKFNIRLIQSKKGLGNALIKGFQNSKNNWVYFIPADFAFGNSEISYIVGNNLYKSYDLFIGSKSHIESKIERPKSRELYSQIFNFILKHLFSIPFKKL